ncbi:GAF domain-containing protein [Pseudonocardia hierapolitana]|uniref:GAF domain-containing protein n=2 Tax=Pseudonocardia hierapolitana TaxID=1128676 RepID=A0A561SYM9_9PSEU|nr:GAF domain-containing protein [Pseudonocardia hierapolitana]
MVVATSSLDELLVGIAELTAGAVPAAVSASVALTAPAWSGYAIAVDERAARLEALQRRGGAGPGPDALRSARVIEAGDLRTERRWPAFARAAAGAGVLALRTVPMFVRDGRPIGVLTVYGATPAAFDTSDRSLADRIAGFATVAVAGTMRNYDDTVLSARLRQALVSRSGIDQAIGIVMARETCSPETALAVLRATARTRGTTLPDVAADLVARTDAQALIRP